MQSSRELLAVRSAGRRVCDGHFMGEADREASEGQAGDAQEPGLSRTTDAKKENMRIS